MAALQPGQNTCIRQRSDLVVNIHIDIRERGRITLCRRTDIRIVKNSYVPGDVIFRVELLKALHHDFHPVIFRNLVRLQGPYGKCDILRHRLGDLFRPH